MLDAVSEHSADYDALARRLPALARAARPTLCGMSACVDARIDLGRAGALVEADGPPEAVAFAAMLKDRVRRGVGGEVRVEWREGPRWLAEHLAARHALGGVGPQAGWVLATLGAPALVNLADRSAHMMAQLPASLLLADGDQAAEAGSLPPRGERRPDIYIFEYTAGVLVGDVVPTRSSRIIVRFDDPGLEHDAGFETLSVRLAPFAGAGLVAGFNGVPAASLDRELRRVFSLTRCWRAAGLRTIHLEMSTYGDSAERDRVLEAARGAVTSLGLSHSEMRDLAPGVAEADLPAAMIALGERLGLERVCVHADHWAVAVTRNDADTERGALMAGCLLASARSAAGCPVVPAGVPEGATFHALPFASRTARGAWTAVAVPSPYLASPATTLGLGDTFTAGCLLVLGSGALEASAEPARSRA